MLEAIVCDASISGSLSDLKLATACLLGFSGFLHFDKLINLQLCDFELQAEMMSIRIVCSKTEQLPQGYRDVVARTGTPTCPVAMLEQHFARTGVSVNDERFLFRPIQHTKNGEVLKGAGKISYSCLRELFNKKLKQLGFPTESFGLHSLRAGGATTAANAKVPDRLFKRHGRWLSENDKDGYVKDSMEARLEVSRKLGLYLFC